MLQGIEGMGGKDAPGKHCKAGAAKDAEAYFTCCADDLTKVIGSSGRGIETPGAAENNPVLKQDIPGHQVIGGIEPSLVGG